MERDHHHNHQQNIITPKQHGSTSSSLPTPPPKEITFTTESPRNNQNPIITTPTNDSRLKRDEWSEGAVSTLLEAYEAKWTLRNRAKLKGHDWEEVAKYVSARGNGSKSAKTQTQCKNKIESMKKRYRSESAAAEGSSWPLYRRLDLLLRGNIGMAAGAGSVAVAEPPAVLPTVESPPMVLPVAVETVGPAGLELGSVSAEKSPADTNGGDRLAKEEGDGINNGTKLTNNELEKNQVDDTDSSTPTIHTENENSKKKPPLKMKSSEKKEKSMKRKREESSNWEIGESIRWVAEVVVRSEQARMDTMREVERMRIEAEAKRGEIDLKRTEIIANTQLQIAKLFAKGSSEDWNKMI